jgi:superfamily II DNA or RNA helicase
MQVIVNNDFISIPKPDEAVSDLVTTSLRYTDKAKQYQLKRLMRSPWGRTSPLVKQLQQEVEGKLYEVDNSGMLKFSSCHYDMLVKGSDTNTLQITDNRKDTGVTVALPWVKKPFDLRPYQQEAVDLMTSNWRGVINFATGLGKTLVATHLVKQTRKRALIVCPSESVAKQFYEQFVEAFGQNKVGFYGGGKKKINDITVGIAASVCKNVDEFKKHDLGLVIFDEVHHVAANTFFVIAEGLAQVGRVFGLTATDFRSDGKDIMITGGCGHVLIRRDIKWGVDNGWLAEPIFIVRQIDTKGYDYTDDKMKAYKEHVLNNVVMKQQIEDDCRKMMAAGRSILCLVDEVEHGKELAANLGIPFATGVDAKSSQYVEDLNKGKIPGLIGTDSKVGEGTDTKNVDVLILANFVASKGPVIQCIGRGLRKQGTKTKCLVLDYVPKGSTMLTRHAWSRVRFYQEITAKVKIV